MTDEFATRKRKIPEGMRDGCPKCVTPLAPKPAASFGTMTCPKCRCILWFRRISTRFLWFEIQRSGWRFVDQESAEKYYDLVIMQIAEKLKVAPEMVRDKILIADVLGCGDSLDIVELTMEFEGRLRRDNNSQ